MPKIRKPKLLASVGIVLAVSAILLGIGYYLLMDWYKSRGINIAKLPGEKVVSLTPGTYWVWIFRKWSLLGVDFPSPLSSTESVGLKLNRVRGGRLIEFQPTSICHQVSSCDREGKVVSTLKIDESGLYRVSCSTKVTKKFVAVFAPESVHKYNLGSQLSFDFW